MFKLQNANPGAGDLVKTTQDAAKILVNAILAAPCCARLALQSGCREHGYRLANRSVRWDVHRTLLKSAFVRRGILSRPAAATRSSLDVRKLPKAAMVATALKQGARFASESKHLRRRLRPQSSLRSLSTRPRTPNASASRPHALGTLGSLEPRSAQKRRRGPTPEDLFQRGRRVSVGAAHANAATGPLHSMAFTTHVVVEEDGELVLKRGQRFRKCGLTFELKRSRRSTVQAGGAAEEEACWCKGPASRKPERGKGRYPGPSHGSIPARRRNLPGRRRSDARGQTTLGRQFRSYQETGWNTGC